jgi:hypothetical protein
MSLAVLTLARNLHGLVSARRLLLISISLGFGLAASLAAPAHAQEPVAKAALGHMAVMTVPGLVPEPMSRVPFVVPPSRALERDVTFSARRAGDQSSYEVIVTDKSVSASRFVVAVGGGTTHNRQGAIEAAAAELTGHGGNVYALSGNTVGVARATGVASRGNRLFLTSNE